MKKRRHSALLRGHPPARTIYFFAEAAGFAAAAALSSFLADFSSFLSALASFCSSFFSALASFLSAFAVAFLYSVPLTVGPSLDRDAAVLSPTPLVRRMQASQLLNSPCFLRSSPMV